MTACAGTAVWGFWPWLRSLVASLSLGGITSLIGQFRNHVSAWSVPEWHHPYSARREFCDAADYDQAKEALQSLVDDSERLRKALQNAIAEHGPSNVGPLVVPEAVEIANARAAVFDNQKRVADAQVTLNSEERMLKYDLVTKLSGGDLIAKGMPAQDGRAAHCEQVIPPHQWRVLDLQLLEATARGAGLAYVGIVIGRPRGRE